MNRLFEKGFDERRRRWMSACVSMLAGRLVSQAAAETGHLDPEFSKLPFAQWLAEGERTSDISWSADILPAVISSHQRLMLRIVIRVAGSSLAQRRGMGEFMTLVQYTDGNQAVWQNHTSLNLETLSPGIETYQIAIAQYAFVLPGDYSLAIAVCDTATLEHSVIFRQAHADPLRPEPLTEAWAGLPAVEFLPPITQPPDVWYLPGIEHRLNLGINTRRSIHIQLLVNTTPSDAGSLSAMQTNMSLMIPALKVLSQMDVRNGSIDVAFLDLTQRRVTFEQPDIRDPDWAQMRKLLLDVRPGLVDIRDLKSRTKMQEFFRDEVGRRLAAADPQAGEASVQIVIALSGPAFLHEQDGPGPIEKPGNTDGRLFYIRFQVKVVAVPGSRKRRGGTSPTPAALPPALPMDDLERAVEPFDAQVYEATSAARFREILAEMLTQISKF
jgi:hypothetical protein